MSDLYKFYLCPNLVEKHYIYCFFINSFKYILENIDLISIKNAMKNENPNPPKCGCSCSCCCTCEGGDCY